MGTWDGLNPPYRTIVADPPWDYPGGVRAGGTPGKPVKTFDLPYSGMRLDEIVALPVSELAAPDAWLFLWTTNRYLPAALERVLPAWGFTYRQLIVWHKLGASPFGGTFTANGGEFLIGAGRGAPTVTKRWVGSSVHPAWAPWRRQTLDQTRWFLPSASARLPTSNCSPAPRASAGTRGATGTRRGCRPDANTCATE